MATPKQSRPARSSPRPCWADLEQLAVHYKRMGDDQNAVRLRHINPRHRQDEKIRDEAQSAAEAYYNCHRMLARILPNALDQAPRGKDDE